MKKYMLMMLLCCAATTIEAGDDGLNYRIMPDNPISSSPVFLEIEWFTCGGIVVNNVSITGFDIAVAAESGICPILTPPDMSWRPVDLGLLPAGDYLLSLNFGGQLYTITFTVRGSAIVAVDTLSTIGLATLLVLMLLFVWHRTRTQESS